MKMRISEFTMWLEELTGYIEELNKSRKIH